jgi:hypothetical protein
MMAVQFYNSATLPQLLSHFNLNLSQSVTPVKPKFKLICLKMWIQFDAIRARVRATTISLWRGFRSESHLVRYDQVIRSTSASMSGAAARCTRRNFVIYLSHKKQAEWAKLCGKNTGIILWCATLKSPAAFVR